MALTVEARLIDFVSKNLDKITINVKGFAKSAGKNFKEVAEGANKVYETLDKTLKGQGGFLGDLVKFSGLSKMFNALEEGLIKVFESATKASPQLAEQLEKVKGKINQLVTEAAQRLLPVFITVFDFLLENWDKVRFAINLVISVAKDLFDLFSLGLQTISLGFKGFILGVTGALNKLGLVNDATFEKMAKDTEAYGEKVAEAAEKVKIFGNTRETVAKGVTGMPKAPKANIDLFADGKETKNTEVDMEEIYKRNRAADKRIKEEALKEEKEYQDFKRKISQETEALRIEMMAEGVDKELALSKQKYDSLKIDLQNDKMFALLTKQEKENAITAIEQAASADRRRIQDEENKERLEKSAELIGKIGQGYQTLGDVITTFATDSEESIRRSADKQTKAIDGQLKRGLITQEQAEAKKQKIMDDAEKRNKERAEIAKQVSVGLAIINTAQGVTSALAHYDYIGAALIGIAGGLEIAKIEAQEFREGGLITGKNRLFTTNEDGRPEYMLNADTVARVGVDNLNRLNRGGDMGSPQGMTVINNNFSPNTTVNSSGGSPKSNFEQVLEDHSEVFFDWFEDKMKKGYGKRIRGR